MNKIVDLIEPTSAVRELQMKGLCRRYPFISRISVGKSILGRELSALKIGDVDDCVLYAGGFHALEWLTCILLMIFAEELAEALDKGGRIAEMDCHRALLGRGIVILPCVNPDGVELVLNGFGSAGALEDEVRRISKGDVSGWSANARGVDLNHNYDAGWHIARQLERAHGINAPAPRRYGGESPASEPETQALVNLCEKMNFRSVYAFHSQGEEIYWKYGSNTPKKSLLMARVLAASSGYKAAEPSDIASHGGFKDWFIEKYSRPGFTVEIGKGKNPLPIEQFDKIYSNLRELLMLGIVM